MKQQDFDGLMQALTEARSFARGQPVEGLVIHVPAQIDVAAIRASTKLTQTAFARRIGVSPGTLRNWEQRRRTPDGPARVLLAMIARNPRVVEETLAAE
ncbi:MAG: helix-turn-helix domain-containing protein [Beijerinckiaceae bacterium]|jgi:putative transcriptional regulator|nr:helix-turn-helix domain-containing protein [Beijerinckiaceae bacterium]